MARLFTLLQAEQLLPAVERAIREAISLRADYQEAESGLQQSVERITMLGGAYVDRDQAQALKDRRQSSAVRLKDSIEKIHSFGCVVKDLDIGLIDFPTLYRGEEVYLCWKLGETGIQYWHGIDEGFRGRKKIDRDFLDNHKGESAN
jgi:hypothetical protein